MFRLAQKFSYANVTATIALFIALSGAAAYAAGKIGSTDIAKDAIKAKHVKDGEIGTAEVRDGALLSDDFASGQLPQGEQGPRGAEGPQGVQGEQGEQGLDGTARAYATRGGCNGGTGVCSIVASKGVTEIQRVSIGRYCVTAPGISSDSTTAVAGIDASLTSAGPVGNATAATVYAPGSCPNPGDFVVKTFFQSPTTVDAGAGTTSVAGNATESNQVGFTIVIP